jgi:hypothetical protein
MNSRNKKIILVVLILLVLVVGYYIIVAVSKVGKTETTIDVAPVDASVTISGKKGVVGTNYLSPGKYEIIVKNPNYYEQKQTVVVGKEAKYVGIAMSPSNSETELAIANDSKLYLPREGIGGQLAQIRGSKIRSITPIINLLPYTDVAGPFSLDYGPSYLNGLGSFIEITDSSPDGRVNALKWIRSQGYNPTNLEIQFNDFQNPILGNQTEKESKPGN